MPPSDSRRAAASIAGLAAVVLVLGGVTAGLALAPEQVPASLVAGPEVTSVPVTYQTLDDARQLPFTAVQAHSTELVVERGGTVTSTACTVGSMLTSGDVPLSIDSVPVVALHTSYPLWRDLDATSRGADVAAVQEELLRLGYAPSTTGVMDGPTRAAVKRLLADRGVPRPDGTLARGQILWLAEPDVSVGACPVSPAAVVAAGDTVVTAGGGLSLLRPVTPSPQSSAARVASFEGARGPVAEDGTVTDPDFLAVVAESPTYTFAQEATEGAPAQVTLEIALATPLEAAVVPAGALSNVSEGTACVSSGGTGHAVTIVSSALGSTYVTVDDGTRLTTVDLAGVADRTRQAASCS